MSADTAVRDVVRVQVGDVLPHLVGKTIAGIVVSRGPNHPSVQWHLVFTDDTTYELYSEGGIEAGANLWPGTVCQLEEHSRRNRRAVAVFAPSVSRGRRAASRSRAGTDQGAGG